MFMQLLYTVYIVALNVILAGFCDEAVTILWFYYTVQSYLSQWPDFKTALSPC